jgi:hypothetical protein
MLSQHPYNYYSHTVLTFKWLDWYLNFSQKFIKNMSIIWTEKDKIMK